MSKNNKILYIFLHIPKCAGSTFRHHIEKNFEKDEYVNIYLGGRYFNLHTQTYDYFESREDIINYLKSLTESQKQKIKILCGHDVYHGVHTFFDREPRYITLLRHPAGRLVSDYNSVRTFTKLEKDDPAWKGSQYFRDSWMSSCKSIEEGGNTLTFENWARVRSRYRNFVTKLLIHRGFFERGKEGIKDALQKFYFVGLMEPDDADMLFLCRLVGVRYFYENQNISHKYFTLTDRDNVKAVISSNNALDLELYENALQVNREFRRNSRFFYILVMHTRLKRFLDIRARLRYALGALYRTSARLRKESNLYTRILDVIKELQWKEY